MRVMEPLRSQVLSQGPTHGRSGRPVQEGQSRGPTSPRAASHTDFKVNGGSRCLFWPVGLSLTSGRRGDVCPVGHAALSVGMPVQRATLEAGKWKGVSDPCPLPHGRTGWKEAQVGVNRRKTWSRGTGHPGHPPVREWGAAQVQTSRYGAPGLHITSSMPASPERLSDGEGRCWIHMGEREFLGIVCSRLNGTPIQPRAALHTIWEGSEGTVPTSGFALDHQGRAVPRTQGGLPGCL